MSYGVAAYAVNAPITSVTYPTMAVAHGTAVHASAAALHGLVTVAAAGASVIAVGAVAVIATRAAIAGAEAAAAAMIRFDQAIKRDRQDRLEMRDVGCLWQDAACAVAVRKQRLARARRRLGGGGPRLPRALDMGATDLEGVHAWCKKVDTALAAADNAIRRRTDEELAHFIRARGGGPDGGPTPGGGAAAALAEYQRMVDAERERRRGDVRLTPAPAAAESVPAGPTVPPARAREFDRSATQKEIEKILNDVDETFSAEDLAMVMRLTENVVAADNVVQARPRLELLREAVRNLRNAAKQAAADAERLAREAREAFERREADRDDATLWLDALELPVLTARYTPQQRITLEQLRAVAEGTGELDISLRNRAAELLRHAQQVAVEMDLRAAMTKAFERRGYVVEDESSTIAIRHRDWDDNHRGQVMFGERVSSTMLHVDDPVTDGEKARERAYCAQHNRDWQEVVEELAGAGWSVGDVTTEGVEAIAYGDWKRAGSTGTGHVGQQEVRYRQLPQQ
jgi:hypothetical protein